MPSLPFTPSYELSDAFSTTFEDPFPYHAGPFESLLDDPNPENNGDTNASDPDNKLLGFGAPIIKLPVLDDNGQTWPAMNAELYGMFFVAEDVFGGETAGRPMELTCYRRNLFQISGNIILSRSITRIINEQGQHVPIYDLTATISALESIDGKSTEIISVPWKTANVMTSEDKAGAPPPEWPLDLSINPELDPTCVSIPIAWKRLQFKHATANNGRRKGLQQHYVIQINLMATLATGEKTKLADIQSGAIIVRGRSPRNFDSRKDVPVSDKKGEPKPRTMSNEAGPTVKVDPMNSQSSYRFYAPNAVQVCFHAVLHPSPLSIPFDILMKTKLTYSQQPLDLPDWSSLTSSTLTSEQPPTPSQRTKRTSTHNRPPIPKTRWKVDSSTTKPIAQTSAAPIDLSLADDDTGYSNSQVPSRTSSGVSDKDRDRGSGQRGNAEKDIGVNAKNSWSKKATSVGSPEDNEEALYEYFPLSLDDWLVLHFVIGLRTSFLITKNGVMIGGPKSQ